MDDVPELLLKPSTTVLPFSVWELSQDPVSFSSSTIDDVGSAATYWRVELPRDLRSADRYLRSVEDAIELEHTALTTVEYDFDALTALDPATTFATASDDSYANVNTRFRALLRQVQADELTASSGAVSFNLLDDVGGELSGVIRQFREFTKRLERSLAYYAFIETFVDLRRQALTTTSWTSTLNTFWSSDITRDRQQQHLRTLRVSSKSRTAIIRTSVVITSGAARIAQRIAIPGGILLALPVVYDLIRQVGLEIQRHQQIVREID